MLRIGCLAPLGSQHHVGQELRAEHAAGKDLRRRGRGERCGIRLLYTYISGAHQPLPHEPSGDALESFHHLFADAAILVGSGLHGQRDDHRFLHRQVLREECGAHLAALAAAAFGFGGRGRRGAFNRRILHRQLQIQLPGHRRGRLFALSPKNLPHQQIELPLRLRELFLKLCYALLCGY